MTTALTLIAPALGLTLSALFDLPSGAVIVWTLAGLALLSGLLTIGPRAVTS